MLFITEFEKEKVKNMNSSWINDYESLNELKEDFGDNALALYALSLRFEVDDLKSVGLESITDGSDDKKLDMIYINTEDHFAVVSQCYFSHKESQSAKGNKASDLNTGLIWLLQMNVDDIPERIKSATVNLRKELNLGNIQNLYIWYVHNLPESALISKELKSVETNLKSILINNYNKVKVNTFVKEIGNDTLQKWYESSKRPIFMDENVTFDFEGGYLINEEDWNSYSTAIKAKDIARLYKKHKKTLFSANIRDYLGSRNSNSNINHGIKETIESEYSNFWAYNNGITILTNQFVIDHNKITLSGMSIVNGAQTTGAISSLNKLPNDRALIHTRIIAVKNKKTDLIGKIIKYNNSQNQVEAADFRSTDKIQLKLRKEFEELNFAVYEAGRRGGSTDKIQRKSNVLGTYYVGQALTAFHGDPITAYNKKREIWSNNKLYNEIFNDSTTANHIIFCWSLIKAIEDKQLSYKKMKIRTEQEEKEYKFLRERGAKFLLANAISSTLETIMSKKININTISFINLKSLNEAISNWSNLLNNLLKASILLSDAIKDGLKNAKDIESCIEKYVVFISMTMQESPSIYTEFSKKVKA